MNKQIEAAVERLMKTGKYTLEEATEIATDDWRIDHGERLEWEPTEEKEKEMRRKNKLVSRKPKAPGAPKVKRERKEDATKRKLIQILAAALDGKAEDLNITNVERMISFHIGDEAFELTLIKKRKK